MTRTRWIDYTKALGIMLVVYGHVSRGLRDADLLAFTPAFTLADSVIYSFHMPLFFFLSGWFFLRSLDKRGTTGLIFSKLNTVLYPFVLWSIVQGVIEVNLSSYTNGDLSYADIFSMFWAPRAPFWFLYALFLIFVLAALLYRLLGERYSLGIFAGTALLYIFQDMLALNDPLFYVLDNFVFFMFGVVLSRLPSQGVVSQDSLARSSVWTMTALAFVLGQILFHGVLTFEDKGMASLLLAFIGIVFTVSTARVLSHILSNYPAKALAFVGSHSLAIYLMHIMAAAATRIALELLGVTAVSVQLVLGCIVGLAAPLLVAELVRRLELPFVFSLPPNVYTRAFRTRSSES